MILDKRNWKEGSWHFFALGTPLALSLKQTHYNTSVMSSPANSATPGPSDNKQQQQQQQQSSSSNGDQQRGSPALSNLPSQADIDKIVASYLQKKGYKATEAIFMKELSGSTLSLDQLSQELASSNKSYGDQVLKYGEEGDPNAYSVSYRSLREWIENSLDWYKVNIS